MSILRRLSIPFPTWQRRPSHTLENELPPQLKDDVFRLHLGSADFARLDEHSLITADICTRNYAEKILKACHSTGIIDPATGYPVTEKINRNMVKEMPVISVTKQRMLVMLLFFWEEELTRWRLLCSEEREVRQRLGEGALSRTYRGELEFALKMVLAKKRVIPSQRDQSGQVFEGGAGEPGEEEEELPTYAEARADARAERRAERVSRVSRDAVENWQDLMRR
ncbi:hypothetical protein DOTSEDRAFT_73985 [Dothistroma septosporum NZE10]|uniref:Uncharacterized protein n=1 Tax=Dothistroma septosporum (strain NZE10 / CBS 128990) TaxID=675120 RepID=N1PGN4_DOTSN|nr:hypothetical protein DOTSEDRAFT_73985 [Dothistroma septosporum NZE10]